MNLPLFEDLVHVQCTIYKRTVKDSRDTSCHALPSGSKPDAWDLVLALERMELGIELTRQRIARENSGISHDELVAKINERLGAPRIELRGYITL